MSTIISFPAEKSKRVLNLKRQENRRMVLMSSLFSVIAVGLLAQIKIENTNHATAVAIRNERLPLGRENGAQRAVASIGEENSAADLAWEKKIAARLGGADMRGPASIGSECRGALCVLGPSYRIVYDHGVRGAAFAEDLAEDGVRGLPASDIPRILQGMTGVSSIKYDSFFRSENSGIISAAGNLYQTWELHQDGQRAPAGFAVVRAAGEEIRALAFCTADEIASYISTCLKKVE